MESDRLTNVTIDRFLQQITSCIHSHNLHEIVCPIKDLSINCQYSVSTGHHFGLHKIKQKCILTTRKQSVYWSDLPHHADYTSLILWQQYTEYYD